MREYLRSLNLDVRTINAIMAEYGKSVTKDKEALKELQAKYKELEENSKKYDELQSLIEGQEQKEANEAFETNLLSAIGEKKFVNDYTKNSIISEVKEKMNDIQNQGKSPVDLLEEIVKDKDGIFENPNKPADMVGTNDGAFKGINQEAFNKMGYRDRVNLKAESPELFESLNNSQGE